jgi:sulfur-carrier protein
VQVTVRLHGVLSEYAGGQRAFPLEVADGSTVDDMLSALAVPYPGVERRVRDETGVVRPHINLFVDGNHLRDLGGVTHRPSPGSELLILPAVSGG